MNYKNVIMELQKYFSSSDLSLFALILVADANGLLRSQKLNVNKQNMLN